MLTKRQKQILDYIEKFIKRNDYAPTIEEIKRHFRLSSLATVHKHIENLGSKGYLKKIENRPRSIELNNENKLDLIQVPLLGTISAGAPIEAIQEKEFIAIPKTRLPLKKNIYALRVAGKSMIDENINNGDIVLIQHQSTAENGQKIVALINNEEATLKTFFKEKNQVRLQPANKDYEPTLIRNGKAMIAIQGIVIDVIKNESLSKRILEKFRPKAKVVKRYNKLPINKIVCKDVIAGLRKLTNESCDIIIADPPYNIGKDFGNNTDKRELTDYISWSKEWINECIRIMKPTATMFVYGFSEILAHLSTEIPINKRWLIWHYTNKNVASLNFWQRSHEAILCCWKNKPLFNRDEIREPYTEGFLNGAAGKVRAGTIGRFGKNGKKTIYNAHERGALPRDVIKMPALAGGAGMIERWFLCKTCNDVFEPKDLKNHKSHNIIKHPTQKPLELSRKLIKSAMPQKNGIVLVPFVGTGSECIAAKELGQKYIGFEINPEYIKIAERILNKTNYQAKLI